MPSFSDPEIQTAGFCPSEEFCEAIKVFPLIHAFKDDVTSNIDASLSWEQLTAPDVNFTIIRPFVYKYARLKNLATIQACLVVRAYFLRLSEENLAHANLNNSRAMVCELMAIKLLRHFASNKLELVAVLTHSWNPLAGAPRQVVMNVRYLIGGDDRDLNEPMSALEMAISTNSKTFLASPLVQSVISDIHSGRIVFSTTSHHSLVADNYKKRQIEVYDYHKASFLNHYRLRVPRYGLILEMANFALLLLFFMLCLANKDFERVSFYEAIFGIFALAFALEEYTASQEHGWQIAFTATPLQFIWQTQMWNVFDTSFIVVWFIYLAFRIKGLSQKDNWSNDVAFDVLACGACILFPRLAFFAVSNSVVVLSLRAMMADFFYFLTIAVICFSGLLFTLWELAQLEPKNKWTLTSIAWLMTQIWFGNTSASFDQATSFHPVFGPILMVAFAALSNTLLLTILISILTNTFARIDANATEEHLFQFAISTIEGVNSDALFSYQPPFNLLAYIILAPLSCFVSPRTLHTANVFLIRLTSFPILIIIAVYERYTVFVHETSSDTAQSLFSRLSRPVKNVTFLEAIVGSSKSLYGALFEVEVPPMNMFDEPEEGDGPEQEDLNSNTKSFPQRIRLHSAPSSPKSLRVPGSPEPTGAKSRSHSQQRETPSASPLARIFVKHPLPQEGEPVSEESMEGVLNALHRMERATDEMPRLREEVREIQERQARIENLLMTLTRGMRGDTHTSHSGTL